MRSRTPRVRLIWWWLRTALVLVLPATALVRPAAAQTDSSSPTPLRAPLHTEGGGLVDADGQPVQLTGVNWFGMETRTFAPHGLWARNYRDMLDQMAQAGFNTIRLPYSNQLFDAGSTPQGIDFQKNPDLKGLTGLEIMDRIVAEAGQRGMFVILDRHRPNADAQSDLWYTDSVPESRWIDDWVMLATRYRGNPTVIGADLHNEPHGAASWGDGNPRTDWRLAAERAGNAILTANPDWLILVEGVEHTGNDWYWWGGNLSGARDAPVRLSEPDKLVYSAHDYGPGVYGQQWFSAPDFPNNLPRVWDAHWGYLQREGVAPVLVGEFGGRSVGSDREGVWQHALLDYLKASKVSYTYWAWNPDSGDTGGILEDDWTTLDQRKLAMLSADQAPGPADTSTATTSTPAPNAPPTPIAQSTTPAVTDSTALGQPTPAPMTDAAAGGQPTQPQGSDTTPAAQPTSAPTTETAAGQTTAAPASGAAPGATATGPAVVGSEPDGALGAPGGPWDPDPQHALTGVGGPNDPDPAHRAARQHDEQLYLQTFGTPWPYAVYATGP